MLKFQIHKTMYYYMIDTNKCIITDAKIYKTMCNSIYNIFKVFPLSYRHPQIQELQKLVA